MMYICASICMFLLLTYVSECTCSLRRVTNLNFQLDKKTSGIAVTDIDQDGDFEVIVAVLDGSNLVVRYNHVTRNYEDISSSPQFRIFQDPNAKTVSVSACDVDGDGKEETYLHNVNDVYPDVKAFVTPDRLIRKSGKRYDDVFNYPVNKKVAPRSAGYSVACVDFMGNGKFGFFVTTVTKDGRGVYKLITVNTTENDENRNTPVLSEIGKETNIRMIRDGRGVSVGPIVGKNRSDIFVTNDNSYFVGSATFRHDGSNVLLRNNGNGTFTDVSQKYGIKDSDENGRGSALGFFTGDKVIDIMYINWLGPSRFVSLWKKKEEITLKSNTTFESAGPSSILLTLDLDNDGFLEIIRGNTDEDNFYQTENQLLTIMPDTNNTSQVNIEQFNVEDNDFPRLHITGMSAADLDGDGHLELFISHKLFKRRTFSIFRHRKTNYNWIRVMPLTRKGAPARGSKVTLTLEHGDIRVAVIGGGCGYMCQMEPVAHFGLGNDNAREIVVVWPDGHTIKKFVYDRDYKKTLSISYNGQIKVTTGNPTANNHIGGASILFPSFCVMFSSFLTVMSVCFCSVQP